MRISLTAIVMLACLAGVAAAEPFKRPDDAAIRRAFAEHVRGSDAYTDAQKQQVDALLARAADGDGADGAVTAGLSVLSPAFASAVTDLSRDRVDGAIRALGALTEADDPYLAANARYYLARAYTMEEQYEKALPLLQALTGPQRDRTQYAGEALFLRGVCETETLDRKQAIATLKDFIAQYPDASERMYIGAQHMVDELSFLEDGTIADVQDRMDYSRRRLDIAESGKRTQGEQEHIIRILDKLIEEAEQKENQGGGGGSAGGQGNMPGQGGAPSGNQNPGGPANQSVAPVGPARMGELHRRSAGDPNESWGTARDREREEVLNAIKARYPDRYREMIEQYYRSLQEEDR